MREWKFPQFRQHLLIVEGSEDQRFWGSYLPHYRRRQVQVLESGGKDGLRRMLSALVLATDFSLVEWIGIIQDADTDARAAFDRIKGALGNAGLDVPRRPWTPTSGNPAVVAFVLPDGENPGDLEALLWEGLADQPEAPCIEDFLSCVGQARGEAVSRIHKSKVYAYLATLESPELRLSHAILRDHIQSMGFQRMVDLIPEEPEDHSSSEG